MYFKIHDSEDWTFLDWKTFFGRLCFINASLIVVFLIYWIVLKLFVLLFLLNFSLDLHFWSYIYLFEKLSRPVSLEKWQWTSQICYLLVIPKYNTWFAICIKEARFHSVYGTRINFVAYIQVTFSVKYRSSLSHCVLSNDFNVTYIIHEYEVTARNSSIFLPVKVVQKKLVQNCWHQQFILQTLKRKMMEISAFSLDFEKETRFFMTSENKNEFYHWQNKHEITDMDYR